MIQGTTDERATDRLRIIGSRGRIKRGIVRFLEVSPFFLAGLAVVVLLPEALELKILGTAIIGGLAAFRSLAEVRNWDPRIQTVVPSLVALSLGLSAAITSLTILATLIFLNVIRVSFTGDRRTLNYTLVASMVALAIPAMIHPDELGTRAIIWMIVLPTICYPVQSRAHSLNAGAGLNARLAGVISDLLTSEDARQSIVHATHELGDADLAIIYELKPDGEIQATAGYGVDVSQIVVTADDSSAVGLCMANEETVFAPYTETVNFDSPPGMGDEDLSSILCCPILKDGVAIGALCAGWKEPVRRADQLNPNVVRILAREAAATLDHSELLVHLADTATRDPLTGLPNRRAWDHQMQVSLLECRKVGAPISIAVLDLDHFKEFNDHHGHQAGDRMLREASAAWKHVLRKEDTLFRWGGEEFTVILPDCGSIQSFEIVERLRAATPGVETSSAGVATWDGTESADQLFARTDAALYRAKESGRDRAVPARAPANDPVGRDWK